MSKSFAIGNMRPGRLGSGVRPVATWPVLIDGQKVAEIVETERGYLLREGDTCGREYPFRGSVEEVAFTRFTGRPGPERWTAHNNEEEA